MEVEVPEFFHQHIFKHHWMVHSVLCECNPLIASKFWVEVMKTLKFQLKVPTSYHPEIDEQPEVMSGMVEQSSRVLF